MWSSFGHTLTCVIRVGEREREIFARRMSTCLGFCLCSFDHLCWGSFAGFSSPRGFPRINQCLSCDCVSFSDPIYDIVVKLSWILMLSILAYGILTECNTITEMFHIVKAVHLG